MKLVQGQHSGKSLFRLALGGLALLSLMGCGGGEDGYQIVGQGGFGKGGGGDPAAHDRGLPNLFISPMGQPYRAARGEPYPVAAWFASADVNHDGRLDRIEFRADAAAFFGVLDANHDGVIDGFEIQSYEQSVAPEILPQIEGLAAGEGMDLSLGRRGRSAGPAIGATRGSLRSRGLPNERPQGAGLYGVLNYAEPVSAADANFDGKVSRAEFMQAADARFTALADGAAFLTLAGLPKTPVQLALETQAKQSATRH